MRTKGRKHRSVELERAAARAAAGLALGEDATLEQIQATVAKLRQVLQRVERQELEPEDWAVLSAVLWEEM
jgi:UDP-N-acetylmuramyl pentapeptide synthase